MKNIDIEIYISNLINFFENNPNDLIALIGDLQKEEFYKKLRKESEKNLKEGKDIILSKEQIINIVVDLKIPDMKYNNLDKIIQKTKFGDIILN
jgi:hypothetical protein